MSDELLDPDAEMRRKVIGMLVGLRKESGIGVAELHRRSGLSRSTIRRMETPGFDPFLSTLMCYARGLGVSVRLEVVRGL